MFKRVLSQNKIWVRGVYELNELHTRK